MLLENMKIGFIGGGNMAEALIKGLLAGGIPACQIQVAEPLQARREYLVDQYAINPATDNAAVAAGSDLVVLAVKPQVIGQVTPQLSGAVADRTLLVSIMAGVRCADIEKAFSRPVRVVRVMPNTPALVLEGAAAISRGAYATDDDLAMTESMFALTGKTWRVEEKLLDAVTGLSGSGPAYVLTFIEALADGGVKNGLSREVAQGLAAQTVLGTARLLLATGEHPAALRDRVTSPGGTTIAGLHALEKGGLRAAVIDGVDAATARSLELGKK